MQLYFIHKESQNKVSLDDIKSNLDKIAMFTDYTKGQEKRYNFSYIPFSDDFEIKVIDEEFTTEEYYQLLSLLPYEYQNTNLYSKVKKKFEEKRSMELKRGF